MFIPDPGSEFFDPGSRIQSQKDSGSQIRNFGSPSKNLNVINPKKFLNPRKYDPGCSSRIPDPDLDFLPFPDPEVKKAPDPGSQI